MLQDRGSRNEDREETAAPHVDSILHPQSSIIRISGIDRGLRIAAFSEGAVAPPSQKPVTGASHCGR